MEKIINNPGLQHLAENIFLNLNYEDLKKCQLINQSTKDILENPLFWIKKLIPKENQNDWIKAIQSAKKSDGAKIISYLKWNFKRVAVENIISGTICCAVRDGDAEIVKILAPLTDNPNTPNEDGNTPINVAELKGFTEIVKILTPLGRQS